MGTGGAAAPTSPEAARLLDAYMNEAGRIEEWWTANYQQLPSAKAVADADPLTRVAIIALVARRLSRLASVLGSIRAMQSADRPFREARALQDLLSALIRPRLPIDGATLELLIDVGAAK